MSGWLKAHRSFSEWEWYKDGNTFRLFFHLLIKANYAPSRFMGIPVPTGSLATGRNSLATELALTPDKIRTALQHLLSTGEITQQVFPKFSIITIVKWKDYQDEPQQIPSSSPANPQLFPTIEEGKKKRSKKSIEVGLEEWEAAHGELTLTMVPKFVQTYGMLAPEYLDRFRSSCLAKDRRYVNFAQALPSWKWELPKNQELKGDVV